jgi:Delta3-Delta2-enoyl-CoA isomerase
VYKGQGIQVSIRGEIEIDHFNMSFDPPKGRYVELSVASEDAPNVLIITMKKPPENRINVELSSQIIAMLRYAQKYLRKQQNGGAVILTSFSQKFWCTGVDLEEGAEDPTSSAEGFFPLLAALLDFPFPTIALITGHTFGGACPLSLSCDYRIMNLSRGYYCMPPVNLGLHFDGIGFLPRLKLRPDIARKMLLRAHRWTAKEAVVDGVIDEAVEPDKMMARAIEMAKEEAPRGKAGVYGVLRNELYGDAFRQLQLVSHRHHRPGGAPQAKI